MGVFVKHESCPRCGSRDNLGRYEDGSAWCFGCHYREPRTSVVKTQQKEFNVKSSDDLCNDFPRHVVEWLGRYDVSVGEALKHGWKYSPQWDQLVFQWFDDDGRLLCSQARNFRQGSKRKYFNQGSPAEILPIFHRTGTNETSERAGLGRGCSQEKRLVIVEDAVSAAKISRQCDAMPCLGSYLPAKKIARLKPFYERLIVWLDADKLKEAYEISTMAKWLGMSTKVVHTELDPKEYNDVEIAAQTR